MRLHNFIIVVLVASKAKPIKADSKPAAISPADTRNTLLEKKYNDTITRNTPKPSNTLLEDLNVKAMLAPQEFYYCF